MPNAKVQSSTQVEAYNASTGTSLAGVTAGNLLIYTILLSNTDNTIGTPTDTQSNTWTALGTEQSSALIGKSRMFYAFAASSSNCTVNVTITPGGSGGGWKETMLCEYSGVTALDTSSSQSSGSSFTLTPASNTELAVEFIANNNSDTHPGTAFTLSETGTNAVLGTAILAHDLDAGTAGVAETFDATGTLGSYHIHGALFSATASTVYYYPGGANVTTGTWTTSTGSGTLASMIDEPTTYDDSDYIQSASNPSTDTCEVPLLNVQAPSTNTGHVIHYRLKSDASCPQVVKLIAGDGSTVVKTWSHTVAGLGVPNSTFTTYDQTLSTGEADAWAAAGYPGSRLRFTAN